MSSLTLPFFIFVFCCVYTTTSIKQEDSLLLQFPCMDEKTVLFIPDRTNELFLYLFLPITRRFLQKNGCINSHVFISSLEKFMPWIIDNDYIITSYMEEMLTMPYGDYDHLKILAILDDLISGNVQIGGERMTIFYFPLWGFKHTELTPSYNMLEILQHQGHDILIYCSYESCPRSPVFPTHRVFLMVHYLEDQKTLVTSIKNPNFKIHQFNKALIAKPPHPMINCKPNMKINFFTNDYFIEPMIQLINIIVHDFIPAHSNLQIGISLLLLGSNRPWLDYSWPIDRRLSEYGIDDRVSRIKNFTVVQDRKSICEGDEKLNLAYPGAPKERLDIFFDLLSSLEWECCISLLKDNNIHFVFYDSGGCNDDKHDFLYHLTPVDLVDDVVNKINAQC